MYRLSSPLSISVGRRKFILNLNNYRNVHYLTLNRAKALYKEWMKKQINQLPRLTPPLVITYRVFKGDKRRCDTGNVCAIHQKFFEDALVELGKLPDDNHNIITRSVFEWGGIDKLNPCVEIMIEEAR